MTDELHHDTADMGDFADDLAELDSFRFDDPDTGDSARAGVIETGADAPEPEPAERLDKEAFWGVFQLAFATPAAIVPAFKPFAIQDNERAMARHVSDAMHRLIELWMPQLLIPQNETFAHLMVVLPFLYVKYKVAIGIFAEMQAARVAAKRPPAPANTNAAPEAKKTTAPPEPANTNAAPSGMEWMDEERATA